MSKLRKELKQTRPFGSRAEEVFLSVLRTADLFQAEQTRVLRSRDLSTPQYNVLRILRGAGPAGLPCQEIGARMVSRMPDVTRLLDRLEATGLVSRERSSSDRRVVHTRIQPAGLAVLAQLDAPVAAMSKQLLAGLADAELAQLVELLGRARGGAATGAAAGEAAATAMHEPPSRPPGGRGRARKRAT